jgi:thermostable 8-oxoguanine DNA glycosylase
MDLSRRVLEHLESKYPKQEDMYEEEVEQLELLPTAFEEGTWSREDLEWIIEWKVGNAFVKPVLRHLRNNDDGEIQKHIDAAVHQSSIRSKVEALTTLNGVGVPVASAILLFINPEQFTVIDKRAWNVLRESEYLSQELSDDPTAEEYLLYLGACWTLANEYDVSIRTLDRALWVLDIEDESIAGD